MTSWRKRLCGSQVVGTEMNESALATWQKFARPSQTLSHGGGFFPQPQQNLANMSTVQKRKSVMLATESYSVLMFKDDGSAIIYTDDENIANLDPEFKKSV